MTSFASDNGTVRDDPPAANDFGLVVRMVGGVVVVGPITVDQGAPNIDANSWPVHQVGPLPPGANTIGFVGIDPAANLVGIDPLSNGVNVVGWFGSVAPMVGQKIMADSIPIVIASDQSAIPITAAALPLPAGAATEATLVSVLGQLDVALSTRASEVTLGVIAATVVASLDTTLSSRASEATLVSVLGQLDVALSTRASEATLTSVLGQLDVALSTRASEATLANVLTTAAFEARINTLGQKVMAASTPVVIASDQSAIPVTGSFTISAIGATGAAVPADAIQIGASDGTNLRAPRVYDTDSGAGAEYTLGANLRRSGAGGSQELLGQTTMALSLPVAIASDQTAIPLTITPSTVGVQANAWNAAAVGVGGTSTAIDCQYTAFVSCFGNTNAATTITVQVSQDNANWYNAFSTVVAPAGDFYLAGNIGARYVRLKSSAAATITATIAGKS